MRKSWQLKHVWNHLKITKQVKKKKTIMSSDYLIIGISNNFDCNEKTFAITGNLLAPSTCMKYKLCWKIQQIKNKFPIRPIDHLKTRNTVQITLKTLKVSAVRIRIGKYVQSSRIIMYTSHYSIFKHLFALYVVTYSQNIQPPPQISISFNYNPKQSYTIFNKLIYFVF